MTVSATVTNCTSQLPKGHVCYCLLKIMSKKKTNVKYSCGGCCPIALNFETGSWYVTQADLEFLVFLLRLPQLLRLQVYASVHPPLLFTVVLGLYTSSVRSSTEIHTQSSIPINMLAYYRFYFLFFFWISWVSSPFHPRLEGITHRYI